MATITLDYNTRNAQAQKTLDYILSLGVFKTQNIRTPRRGNVSLNTGKDDMFLYSVSEQVLAKEWLNKEEDEAWKDL